MKNFAQTLALILTLATPAVAAPLQKQQVAADAKWLLHLDVDKLRSTSSGDYLIRNLIDKKLAEPKAKLKEELDFDLDLTKAHSITAYGTAFQTDGSGVLLVQSDFDVEKILDGAIAKSAQRNHEIQIVKTEKGGLITYAGKGIVVSVHPGQLTIISRSLESNLKAAGVLDGNLPNLTSSQGFSEFVDLPKTFFFFAAAQGFSSDLGVNFEPPAGEENNPKARILKLTDSGRIALGQDDDQLVLDLALKARTPDVVKQMQQVVQGMIALASLSRSDDPDVQELTDAAKVSAAGSVVDVSVRFPADKAMLMLNKNVIKRLEHNHPDKPIKTSVQ